MSTVACTYETEIMTKLGILSDSIYESCKALSKELTLLSDAEDVIEEGYMIRDTVLPKMSELRSACDEAEVVTAEGFWPFPTYGELLFGVR